MYGSEKSDLLVKYYDLAFGITGAAEAEWYLNKVDQYGGPVLDLCCGTGRFSLMLACQGFEVTGIDQSIGMLNLFKKKLKSQSSEVRQRIQIENQRMTDFQLDHKFKTVICCDAFFHNLTVEHEIKCLRRIADHLLPDGRLIFNIHNPNCNFILKSKQSGGKIFEERGRYELPDGSGILLVEQATATDIDAQMTIATLRLTRLDLEGRPVEVAESGWKTRYLFKYEAIHLLHRCGFKVEKVVGDYENGPVTENSQLIFDARLME
jgi:SAM-dependent methyltransferase